MRMLASTLLIWLPGILACHATSAQSPGAMKLRCTLSEVEAPSAGPPRVRWELANDGPATVLVLAWQTPLEDFRGPVFAVTRDGLDVPYLGPVVKRGDPEASSYVRLPAGGSVTREVDLGAAYDVSAPGRYRIEFSGGLLDVIPDDQPVPRRRDAFAPLPLACPALELTSNP